MVNNEGNVLSAISTGHNAPTSYYLFNQKPTVF